MPPVQILASSRPFQDSVLDMIPRTKSEAEMFLLLELIKITKVPSGHDEIILVIKGFWGGKSSYWDEKIAEVEKALIAQKQEALAEPAGEQEAFTPDKLDDIRLRFGELTDSIRNQQMGGRPSYVRRNLWRVWKAISEVLKE
jgi:hypothetical protein